MVYYRWNSGRAAPGEISNSGNKLKEDTRGILENLRETQRNTLFKDYEILCESSP